MESRNAYKSSSFFICHLFFQGRATALVHFPLCTPHTWNISLSISGHFVPTMLDETFKADFSLKSFYDKGRVIL